MKKFAMVVAVLVSMSAVAEAGVRENIAARRAAREEAKQQSCSSCQGQQVQQHPTVVQAVGQVVRDTAKIAPAVYYSLPIYGRTCTSCGR